MLYRYVSIIWYTRELGDRIDNKADNPAIEVEHQMMIVTELLI